MCFVVCGFLECVLSLSLNRACVNLSCMCVHECVYENGVLSPVGVHGCCAVCVVCDGSVLGA